MSLLQELWERIAPILVDQALNALVSAIFTTILSAIIALWVWSLSWTTTTSSDQDQEENFTWEDISNQLEVLLGDSSTEPEEQHTERKRLKPKIFAKGLDCSRVVKNRN